MEEISGEFVDEFVSRGESDNRWVVGEIKKTTSSQQNQRRRTTVVGNALSGELRPGLQYRFFGRFVQHERFGLQFKFSSFVVESPRDRIGTILYLASLPGIGEVIARRIWDEYGFDSVRTLREKPSDVAEKTARLTQETAQVASRQLDAMRVLEAVTIELLNLLDGIRAGKSLIRKIIRIYGNRGAEVLKKNPYLLLKFPGSGFAAADALYLKLGYDPAGLERQMNCLLYEMESDRNGNTWFSYDFCEKSLSQRISGADVRTKLAIELGVRAGALSKLADSAGDEFFTILDRERHERLICDAIKTLLSSPPTLWPDESLLESLSSHQREAVQVACSGRIALLGGTPGTGKTYSAAQLARWAQGKIAVCAPTGKAAVRITQALREHGLKIDATTIHRLLGCQPREETADGPSWNFAYNAENRLPFDVILVDEVSMCDVELFARLVTACKDEAHVLLVGDVNQLPPVGHGAPLRDLIAAGVPYGELSEIRRNSGMIVECCRSIKETGTLTTSDQIDLCAANPENLICVETRSPREQMRRIIQVIDSIVSDKKFDPVWELQVLAPINESSPISRRAINEKLQDLLNPHKSDLRSSFTTPFRAGDKVINLRNSSYGDSFVANGEVGRVIEATNSRTTIVLSEPDRVVTVPRKTRVAGDAGCDWDLGYCCTVHKFQGSQAPIIVCVLDESVPARMVSSRESIYTAISRAEKLCVLLGRKSIADEICERQILHSRKTFLAERVTAIMPAWARRLSSLRFA